jgi:hypothetical protein
MDTRLLIIVAVVELIGIAIMAYRYPQAIGLKFKGHGLQAELQAKGRAATAQSGSRNVSIGGNATDARLVTGDDAPAKKPTTGAGRNVSIGGSAEGSTIVTGDRNKIG